MKRANRKLSLLVLGSAIIASSIISSCSKSSNSGGGPTGPTAPTNPGGYDSSAQISPSTLVAYFPFEGSSYNDVKGGLVGVNHGAEFTAGIKGQAYSGSGQSFVTYGNPGALASLKSFTLSAWFKIAATPVNNPGSNFVVGQGTMGVFSMYDSVTNNPNLLLLEFEPYTPVSGDSLRVHAGFNNTGNTAGAGWTGIIPEGFMDTVVNKWTHVVMTYDGGSSTYTLYENGTAINVSTAWTPAPNGPTPTSIFNGPTGGATTGPMGNLNFKDPPNGFIIGGWPYNSLPSNVFGAQPWAGYLQGGLDEVRIYSSALNSTDVKSLDILERAGF